MDTPSDDNNDKRETTQNSENDQKNTVEFRHRSEDMNIAPKETPPGPAPSRRISGPQTSPPSHSAEPEVDEVSTGNIDKNQKYNFWRPDAELREEVQASGEEAQPGTG